MFLCFIPKQWAAFLYAKTKYSVFNFNLLIYKDFCSPHRGRIYV